MPSLTYSERLRALNLLPLNYYTVLTDILLLSKLMNPYYAFNISEHVNIVQRRSSYWFVLPKVKKEFQRYNFFLSNHILLYGIQCIYLLKSNVSILEMFQKKVLKWICGTGSYIQQIRMLKIISLPMYLQSLNLLALSQL